MNDAICHVAVNDLYITLLYSSYLAGILIINCEQLEIKLIRRIQKITDEIVK